MPGGPSRSLLQQSLLSLRRGHRLARWSLTLVATQSHLSFRRGHRLARWSLTLVATQSHLSFRRGHRLARWSLTLVATQSLLSFRRGHRLARWLLTLVATTKPLKLQTRPPACPVVPHARCYNKASKASGEATGLPGGPSRSLLPKELT